MHSLYKWKTFIKKTPMGLRFANCELSSNRHTFTYYIRKTRIRSSLLQYIRSYSHASIDQKYSRISFSALRGTMMWRYRIPALPSWHWNCIESIIQSTCSNKYKITNTYSITNTRDWFGQTKRWMGWHLLASYRGGFSGKHWSSLTCWGKKLLAFTVLHTKYHFTHTMTLMVDFDETKHRDLSFISNPTPNHLRSVDEIFTLEFTDNIK